MCGPLAMAVTTGRRQLLRKALYNGGRIFTYGIAGALMASFGNVFAFSGSQLVITTLAGAILILMGIAGITGLKIPFLTPGLLVVAGFIKSAFNHFLQKKTYVSVWFLGMVNGLLPCGVTYIAITYCITLAGPLDGFNFMLWFGVGTFPAMLGLTSAVAGFIRKLNFNGPNVTRYSYILIGLSLVLRVFIDQPDMVSDIRHSIIVLCQ
jgi:uncharacterized protein